MEIIVKCPCGCKYRFNEEPVNGKLAFPVKCTTCGADGTQLANEYIRKSLSGELELEEQKAASGWKRFFKRKRKEDTGAAQDATNDEPTEPEKTNLGLGAVGALMGGFIGMMIWFFITRKSGWEVGFVAWGVGVCAGLGARAFVPNGNFHMAMVAAFSAFLAIMGGQVLVFRSFNEDLINKSIGLAYEDTMAFARGAKKAKTDEDIRELLVQYGVKPGEFASADKNEKRYMRRIGWFFRHVMKKGAAPSFKELISEPVDPADFTGKEITEFGEKELPELLDLLNGKPSRAEFEKKLRDMVHAKISSREMLLQSWSPYQLLWLLLGVGSAYRLAYNKSETEDI